MIEDNLSNIDVVELRTLEMERTLFSSYSEALNRYFHKIVSQDEKRKLAKCFVLIDKKQQLIIGYYTLSASSVLVSDVPKERLKREIRYPNIPAVLMGRLAIDQRFERQGYGKFLIADAIHRIQASQLGIAVLIVEAKDDNAVAFYEKLGFIRFHSLNNDKRKLFYPLTNLIKHEQNGTFLFQ